MILNLQVHKHVSCQEFENGHIDKMFRVINYACQL